MSRRAKTPRFKEFKTLANTYDNFLGRVNFGKNHPHVIELGCGKGEFVAELAKRHPKTKFAGVDIKSDRMWFGARRAAEAGISNLVYVRAHAKDLKDVLEPGSLREIWLTFPDPYPKERKAKHRLTNVKFMAIYKDILEDEGCLKLKTDNDGLFEWSLEEVTGLDGWRIAASGRDLHGDMPEGSDWRILTQYEKKFLKAGETINYIELQRR